MVAVLSIVAMTGCKDSPWTPMGSADLVLSEIKLGGAAKVSRRIDSDENFGRSVTAGIATGDSSWLQVARQITPSSAAAQATLSIALASALTRAPARSPVDRRDNLPGRRGVRHSVPESGLGRSHHLPR